jgi:hypothetical protein
MTLGLGKQAGANLDADWGSIQILIFPTGTLIPVEKPVPEAISSTSGSSQPAQVTAAVAHNP